jgi:hypothetical protein
MSSHRQDLQKTEASSKFWRWLCEAGIPEATQAQEILRVQGLVIMSTPEVERVLFLPAHTERLLK